MTYYQYKLIIMNQIEYFEKMYETWDGTPEHAMVILRHLNLANKTVFKLDPTFNCEIVDSLMKPIRDHETDKGETLSE